MQVNKKEKGKNGVYETSNSRTRKWIQSQQLPDAITSLRDSSESRSHRTTSQSLVPESQNEMETSKGRQETWEESSGGVFASGSW